jgi:hypothetical protein
MEGDATSVALHFLRFAANGPPFSVMVIPGGVAVKRPINKFFERLEL